MVSSTLEVTPTPVVLPFEPGVAGAAGVVTGVVTATRRGGGMRRRRTGTSCGRRVNVVCWGRQAEIAGQYLTKGKQIYVEGRLQTRSWDDKQSGEKKYRTEVICQKFQMIGSRGGLDGGSQSPAPGPESPGDFQAQPEDDDIPF